MEIKKLPQIKYSNTQESSALFHIQACGRIWREPHYDEVQWCSKLRTHSSLFPKVLEATRHTVRRGRGTAGTCQFG